MDRILELATNPAVYVRWAHGPLGLRQRRGEELRGGPKWREVFKALGGREGEPNTPLRTSKPKYAARCLRPDQQVSRSHSTISNIPICKPSLGCSE